MRPANRYDKHATIYRAAIVRDAVIAWTRHVSKGLGVVPVDVVNG